MLCNFLGIRLDNRQEVERKQFHTLNNKLTNIECGLIQIYNKIIIFVKFVTTIIYCLSLFYSIYMFCIRSLEISQLISFNLIMTYLISKINATIFPLINDFINFNVSIKTYNKLLNEKQTNYKDCSDIQEIQTIELRNLNFTTPYCKFNNINLKVKQGQK